MFGGGTDKGSTGSGGQVAEDTERGPTVSGGAIPPRVKYQDDGVNWVRDPRMHRGETAQQRGWQQCECNGTCGRKSCPGRRLGYMAKSKERVARAGCPNPVLSETQSKPRCASCVCRARDCEVFCNMTGFCVKHRATQTSVIKRPASSSEQAAAAGVLKRRPAAHA